MPKFTWQSAAAASLLLISGFAHAFDFSVGDIQVQWKNQLTSGVAVRTDQRDERLIGKLNVPGQQTLCQKDDCLSFSGNPAPNQRLINATGGFSASNSDNGDLNYNQWGVVAATNQLRSNLTATWGNLIFRVAGIGFFDPENVDFQENHANTLYQPAHTDRANYITRQFARGGQLLNASLRYSFEVAGHNGALSVGSQTVHWGESTFVALNSINEFNPPNAALLRMPGSEISQVFKPVPSALFSIDLTEKLSLDAVYQLQWVPVRPDPSGSYYSTNDVVGGGTYAVIGLGQFPEDPDKKLKLTYPLSLITSTSTTASVLPDARPPGTGQYGLHLSYFADWLNDGTELGFYFLNYHSRLPYLDVVAANASCLNGVNDIITGLLVCRGFNGTLNPTGTGLEPTPIDTEKLYLEYPRNIQMYGMSFNTNVGAWSLAAEYSFRPNLPVQVDVVDVVFAGLQPAFPEHNIPLDPLGLNLPGYTLLDDVIPGRREAVPDFLSVYRGIRVKPGDHIQGYERLKVGQFDLTGIRAISGSNPIGANQIIFITEVGFTNIFNLPNRSQIQFEGGAPYNTHYSAGADGTGNGGMVDTLHINPTHQTRGFANSFAWGFRLAAQLEYDNVIWGLNFKPTLALYQDVSGIAPLQFQNFVAGSSQITVGTGVEFTRALSGQLLYQIYTGGGDDNRLRDRDNIAVSLSYAF